MNSILEIVVSLNPIYVVASAVAQLMLAGLWFGCVARQMDRYYLAADKGVRRFEHAIQHYRGEVVCITALLCAVLRSVILMVVIAIFHFTTFKQYQEAAVVAAVVGMTRVHRSFSCQRPFQIVAVEMTYEFSASMVAAVVCYLMKMYGF